MKYSPTQVIELLGQSKETIRVWSVTFAKYLSPTASPTNKGQHRLYDESDLGVFFLVKEMRSRGITFDEIALSLANGERATVPTSNSLALTPTEQIQALQAAITDLQTALTENSGQNKLLKEQNAALQEKVERLTAEKAVLQYRLLSGKGSE